MEQSAPGDLDPPRGRAYPRTSTAVFKGTTASEAHVCDTRVGICPMLLKVIN
jgi:hypothetical protein